MYNQSWNLHGNHLEHHSAWHYVKPYFSCGLWFCRRRCNGCDYDYERADTSDNYRQTHQRKYSGIAASVNGILNGFVKTVPCSRKAAYDKSEYKQKQASSAPALDFGSGELLRLIEVGASCFNHYCIGCGVTQLNVLHNVHRRISLG